MIKHSLTHTLTENQKHNQNNNRQKNTFRVMLTPRKLPDMSLIINMGTGTGTVPPKNINQCYYIKI